MESNTRVPNKSKVILLDVYETLLDMSEVERRVNSLMASRTAYNLWFELFMQYCLVDNCTVQFNEFSSIARATMMMTGKLFGGKVREEDISDVLELLKHVPIKEGVQEGLSLFNDQNFRIAALTNSPENIVRRRMEYTGLISYFKMVLSAEHVKKYKPCIEVYEWAASKLEVEAPDILLVSAHGLGHSRRCKCRYADSVFEAIQANAVPFGPYSHIYYQKSNGSFYTDNGL